MISNGSHPTGRQGPAHSVLYARFQDEVIAQPVLIAQKNVKRA
jgi:hypothetical protein